MTWVAYDSQGHVIGTIEDNHPNVSVTIEAWRRAGFRVEHRGEGAQQSEQQKQDNRNISVQASGSGTGQANLLAAVARSASSTKEFKKEVEEIKRTGRIHVEIEPSEFLSTRLMQKAIAAEEQTSETYTPYRALGAAMEASMRGEDVREAVKQNIMGSSASLKAIGLGFLAGLASTPETIVLAPWTVKSTVKAVKSGTIVKQLSRPSGLAFLAGQAVGLSALGLPKLGAPRTVVGELTPVETLVKIPSKQVRIEKPPTTIHLEEGTMVVRVKPAEPPATTALVSTVEKSLREKSPLAPTSQFFKKTKVFKTTPELTRTGTIRVTGRVQGTAKVAGVDSTTMELEPVKLEGDLLHLKYRAKKLKIGEGARQPTQADITPSKELLVHRSITVDLQKRVLGFTRKQRISRESFTRIERPPEPPKNALTEISEARKPSPKTTSRIKEALATEKTGKTSTVKPKATSGENNVIMGRAGTAQITRQTTTTTGLPEHIMIAVEKPDTRGITVGGITSGVTAPATLGLKTTTKTRTKTASTTEPKLTESTTSITSQKGVVQNHRFINWVEPKLLERPVLRQETDTILTPKPVPPITILTPKPIIRHHEPPPKWVPPKQATDTILDTIPRPTPRPTPPDTITTTIQDTKQDTTTIPRSYTDTITGTRTTTTTITRQLTPPAEPPLPPLLEWKLKPKRGIKAKKTRKTKHKKRRIRDVFKELVFKAPDFRRWL